MSKKSRRGLALALVVLSVIWMVCIPIEGRAAELTGTDTPETVRVGFFAFAGYHEIDEDGNRSGYGYDFLNLTEKYVNLNYEYVGYEKSWEETQQMLLDGEIDLATSAHMTEERLEKYDFSLPIGTNTITINTRESETRFTAGDYATYDGMTIGLLDGSSSNAKVANFAADNGFSYQAKYYNNTDSLERALLNGEVDAVATSSLRLMKDEKILSEVETQYFYAIVKKGNTALLDKINYAITQLNNNEGDWKNDFYYNNYTAPNEDGLTFTEEEKRFIERFSSGGETLVIATDSDWKPFSWKEGDSYVGILPEYFAACMELCGMNYTFYDGEDDAVSVAEGDIDLYLGHIIVDGADDAGFVTSSSILENSAAYLRRRDGGSIKKVAVAATTPVLNEMLPNADSVTVIEYPTQDEAKQAVKNGDVDAALLYRYDAEYTVNQNKSGKLAFALIPNTTIQIRAAIREESDHTLMSILMKCMKHLDEGQKSAIISECISFSATEMTLGDYVALHPKTAVAVCVIWVIVLFAIVGFLVYGSRERMYRKKLQEACRQAEAANNAKTTFLFNMSHDIRTPMNAIIGFADLMERHMDDSKKRADYLRKIQDSSAVLLSIINNVLEMARIEKGTVELAENAWSAEQFNDTLYSVFHDMMTQKGINFTRQVVVEHSYVFCDPIKLREVFLNILSNACKYTESGGSVNMHLEEIPSDRSEFALYQTTITDTGVGMDPEFVPHIFEEFSRENNSTENKIEGTGLGMAIVKRLVELMDGTIEVSSEKGKGSTFVVTIPHRIADRSDLIDHSAVTPDEQLFVGKRILLAEDNDLNAEIAYEILTEAGFAVERAENGQRCVEMLQEADARYYDLILMDIQMPLMNGFEATEYIRGLSDPVRSKIPIVAMTANAFEEDKRDAYNCGMNEHLAKPINVHELMKILTRVLKK